MILRHLQKSGCKPIILLGGATSKVGDPTGKDDSRNMLTDEEVEANIDGISKVFERFLEFDDNPTSATIVNNEDWLGGLKYLNFLRDYGKYFTINRMLSFESVKQRLARDAPLSFLEFNYMILQAYDFLELRRRLDVQLQLGGSDQWGNIVSGVELNRRVDQRQVFGLTTPLLTTSDGKKMGKTESGAIWLNADKLSPYDYWQFWRNTTDGDVIRFLKLFTELPLDRIAVLAQLEGAELNGVKRILADETTTLLHGEQSLPEIHAAVDRLYSSGAGAFSSGDANSSLPRIGIPSSSLEAGGVKLSQILVGLKLCASKKEAGRLITQGGAKINDVVIKDPHHVLSASDFEGGGRECIAQAGKKRAGVIFIE
jgi:tyrosyl-tRNA synthetase